MLWVVSLKDKLKIQMLQDQLLGAKATLTAYQEEGQSLSTIIDLQM